MFFIGSWLSFGWAVAGSASQGGILIVDFEHAHGDSRLNEQFGSLQTPVAVVDARPATAHDMQLLDLLFHFSGSLVADDVFDAVVYDVGSDHEWCSRAVSVDDGSGLGSSMSCKPAGEFAVRGCQMVCVRGGGLGLKE